MLAAALKRVPVAGGGSFRLDDSVRATDGETGGRPASASSAGEECLASAGMVFFEGAGTTRGVGDVFAKPNKIRPLRRRFSFAPFAPPAQRALPPSHTHARARARPPSTMINFKKLDAWRANPLLTHTMRASAPGFLLGAAAFAVYVAYDKTVGKKEGGGGHH